MVLPAIAGAAAKAATKAATKKARSAVGRTGMKILDKTGIKDKVQDTVKSHVKISKEIRRVKGNLSRRLNTLEGEVTDDLRTSKSLTKAHEEFNAIKKQRPLTWNEKQAYLARLKRLDKDRGTRAKSYERELKKDNKSRWREYVRGVVSDRQATRTTEDGRTLSDQGRVQRAAHQMRTWTKEESKAAYQVTRADLKRKNEEIKAVRPTYATNQMDKHLAQRPRSQHGYEAFITESGKIQKYKSWAKDYSQKEDERLHNHTKGASANWNQGQKNAFWREVNRLMKDHELDSWQAIDLLTTMYMKFDIKVDANGVHSIIGGDYEERLREEKREQDLMFFYRDTTDENPFEVPEDSPLRNFGV